jgi:hypothetical protein
VASERVSRRRRTGALAALAVVAVLLIAFLVARLSGSEDTPEVSGAAKDVVATVMRFQAALAGRGGATICNELYTTKARVAAGGAKCPATLAQSAGGLREPRVKILSVVVRGQAATVTVSASVNGKPPVTDAIQLVRERGRFRVASAGVQ